MHRFTISSFLLLTTITAVLSVEFGIPPKFEIIQTDDECDLAISGRGYFEVTDETDCTSRFTRSGKLRFNDSTCFLIIGQAEFQAEPEFCIPEGTQALRVDRTGTIFALSNSQWDFVGLFRLALIDNAVNSRDRLGVNTGPRRYVTCFPGEFGTGYILQGAIEHKKFSPHRVIGTLLSVVLAATCFANRRLR